jgi:hypothetical protein
MKQKFAHLFLIIGFALAACGAAATPAPDVAQMPSVERPAEEFAPSAPGIVSPGSGGGEGGAGFDNDGSGSGVALADRLVIRNANLSIVVDDSDTTVKNITQMAEGMGGFVVSLNTYQAAFGSQGTIASQANMTVRVPSEKLNEALEQIKGMATEVKSENISGQDVTSEYTDLKSRLTNLEAAERQLQSIMEEATKTEDVLAVYNQLVYTREQIEVIRGQMKYYEESAALSAITIDIIPNVANQPIEIGGWRPDGVAKEAIETLIRMVQGIIDFLIRFTIICGPFLLVLGIPVILIVRWMRNNARKVEQMEREEKKG